MPSLGFSILVIAALMLQRVSYGSIRDAFVDTLIFTMTLLAWVAAETGLDWEF